MQLIRIDNRMIRADRIFCVETDPKNGDVVIHMEGNTPGSTWVERFKRGSASVAALAAMEPMLVGPEKLTSPPPEAAGV